MKTQKPITKTRKDEDTKEEGFTDPLPFFVFSNFRAFEVTPVFALSLYFPCAEYLSLFHYPDLLFTDNC
jgi:hypothetical protein